MAAQISKSDFTWTYCLLCDIVMYRKGDCLCEKLLKTQLNASCVEI